MYKIQVGLYIIATRDLAGLTAFLARDMAEGAGSATLANSALASRVLTAISEMEKQLASVPMSHQLRMKFKYLPSKLSSNTLTVAQALTHLQELQDAVIYEQMEPVFLAIPTGRAELYEQSAPFGYTVETAFPDANRDIAAAARCVALDEWTAAVFHSMRVIEHGLRWLASDLGLGMTPDFELENWKNIIDQIEKAIRAKEAEPKSSSKSEQLRFYSQTAIDLRYFKDAWRNHVSHSHVHSTYDEFEAMRVYDHVKNFAQGLADRIVP